MKNKKPNAEQLWKHLEDDLVPRLRLSVIDRAVYSHLLRHSRLEGRLRLRFSIARIAHGTRLGGTATRRAVRRLVAQGALRVVERGKAGHLFEVRLPEEIRAARGPVRLRPPRAINLEETDFLQSKTLRQPSTCGREADAFIVSACSPPGRSASTMLCQASGSGAIPTATWSLAVWNATQERDKAPPRIFFAGSTASGA